MVGQTLQMAWCKLFILTDFSWVVLEKVVQVDLGLRNDMMVGKVESRRTNKFLINKFERNSPRGKLQWNWWNENDEKV